MFNEILSSFQGTLLFFFSAFFLYWYFSSVESYWKKRGIKSTKPRSVLRNYFFPPKKPMHDEEIENYKKYGRIYGDFEPTPFSAKPCLVVGEPHLLRDIMLKDFSTFTYRLDCPLPDEVFNRALTHLRDEDWKRVRSIVSPTFSTGKIKKLLNIFKESSKTLLQNFKMAIEKGKRIELNRLYGTLAMDVIASSAFSTKIESHNNPDNEFVKHAKDFFATSGLKSLLLLILPPPLAKILYKLKVKSERIESSGEFFKKIAFEIVEERKKTGQRRNDFLQLLIDAAEDPSKEEKWEDKLDDIASNYGDDAANHPVFKSSTSKYMTKDELVAQSVIFLLAGYHTTALTLSFATHLLAVNPEAQDKAYQELKDVLQETNGELTYEALQKLKYLDNVISETLRVYSPIIKTARTAEADYKLGDTGIIVPKGMIVYVPSYAMHLDPDFFPDPERFDPDRFSPEQRSKQIPYTYLPFGAGPRNCIGMRFALLETKVCLAYVLSAFHIKRSPEMKEKLEFWRGLVLVSPKDIVVQMEMRKDCPLKE